MFNRMVKGFHKMTHIIAKNSPLILTVVGCAGLIATSVLAYRSAKKIDEVSTVYEEQMAMAQANDDLGYEVEFPSKSEYIRECIAIGAPAVVSGVASIAALAWSYNIMSGRITGLSAALAVVNNERMMYRQRVVEKYGPEVDKEFSQPRSNHEKQLADDGSLQHKVHGPNTCYLYFRESIDYASDDHHYNLEHCQIIIDKLYTRYSRRGVLTLNTIYQAFGIDKTRDGSYLGFNDRVHPSLKICVEDFEYEYVDGHKIAEPQIIINWSYPTYVYEDVDYSSDVL